MQLIPVRLKTNPYTIYITDNQISKIPALISGLKIGNFGIIITSPKVYSLYKKTLAAAFDKNHYKVIIVCNGEEAKSQKYFFRVIEKILEQDQLNRKIFIVALGGGTIGDLGGFIAATYKRGIPFVQIPTTLLAQIDASIGGKTAIDMPQAKNIIGAFYQPKAVLIDQSFLKTLPKKEVKQGLAEAIKYAIISKPEFFDFLAKNAKNILSLEKNCLSQLITTCVKAKVKVVEEDENETKGIRTILNFGHTLAHALETALNYRKLSHGEAVALGMIYAADLSALLGKCSNNTAQQIKQIINNFGLPTKISADYRVILKAFTHDKKFISGKIRLVLLKALGEVEVTDGIPIEIIKKSIKSFLQ
jgi:3-dehydroquinate synthase